MRRSKQFLLLITALYKSLARPFSLCLCALVPLCLFFISSTYAAENPTFFKGYTRMNEGSHDEAIIYFNLSLKSNPEYLPTYSHLALCYERKKEFQKAKEVWTKYTEFDSYFKDTVITHTNLIDRFLEAGELLANNQTDDALPILEEIITLDKYPMSVLWLYAAEELTNIYYQAKSFPQAIPLYEKVTLYYPKDVTEEMLFQYAYSLQREKEFQKALDAYKRIDESFSVKDIEKATKYKNLACLCYEGLGDEAIAKDEYKQAKLIYQKATQAFPSTENIPRLREKKQRAEEKLAFLYKTEADTYSKLKEYSKAMEFYKKVTKECSQSSYFSESQQRVGQIKELRKSIWQKARQLYQENKYKEASEKYEFFLEMFEGDEWEAWAKFWLGNSYAGAKDYRRAVKCFIRLAKNHPENGWAPMALYKAGIHSWQRLGNPLVGVKILGYLIREYPGSMIAPDACYYRGVIYYEQEKYRKAHREFSRLLKMFPESGLTKRAKVGMIHIEKEYRKSTSQ